MLFTNGEGNCRLSCGPAADDSSINTVYTIYTRIDIIYSIGILVSGNKYIIYSMHSVVYSRTIKCSGDSVKRDAISIDLYGKCDLLCKVDIEVGDIIGPAAGLCGHVRVYGS